MTKLSCSEIADLAAARFKVSRRDILHLPADTRASCACRAAMYVAWRVGHSVKDIARGFGGLHQTTVQLAIQSVAEAKIAKPAGDLVAEVNALVADASRRAQIHSSQERPHA